MNTLTIIADSNIAQLEQYFNSQILGINSRVIAMSGRDISADVLIETQADALLVRSVTQVNESLLQDNQSLRFVASATIGTDHIQQDYLSSRNIHFTNACGCSKHSVAQYVLTAILQLQSKLATQPTTLDLTLGIVGLGNIGSTLASYANDLGWQVLAYDPFLTDTAVTNTTVTNTASTGTEGDGPIQLVEFEQLLEQADVVSLHVPLTTSAQSPYPTYHLIDESKLALMSNDCILINSARGQVIKESALLADINHTGRPVVLDVFEHEPFVSEQLLSKLAIATPHIAGYTLEGKLRGTQMIYQDFCHYFGLQVRQSMDKLLPANPYHWQDLLLDVLVDKKQLAHFYPIMNDDKMLRNAISYDKQQQSYQVQGKDFDKLRKNYPLRREWLGQAKNSSVIM